MTLPLCQAHVGKIQAGQLVVNKNGHQTLADGCLLLCEHYLLVTYAVTK